MRPSSWASITSWCFANRDQPAGRPSTPGPGQPRFSQPASAPGRCADRPRLPVAGSHPAAGVWRLPRGLPGELPARRPPARQRQRSIRPLPDVRLLRADGPPVRHAAAAGLASPTADRRGQPRDHRRDDPGPQRVSLRLCALRTARPEGRRVAARRPSGARRHQLRARHRQHRRRPDQPRASRPVRCVALELGRRLVVGRYRHGRRRRLEDDPGAGRASHPVGQAMVDAGGGDHHGPWPAAPGGSAVPRRVPDLGPPIDQPGHRSL